MIIYELTQQIFNDLNNNFPDLNIGYEENGKYYVEEFAIDRLIQSGLAIDQYFMNNYSKATKSYLSKFAIYPYRILNLVADDFKNYPIENIDFTLHLKSEYALNKTGLIYDQRGRPISVDYEYNNTLYARRKFQFDLNEDTFFPERRREYLAYYREDDSLGDYFLIKDEKLTDPNKFNKVLSELRIARQNNVNKIELLVLTNVKTSNPNRSFDQVLFMVGEFWDDYSKALSNFVQVGIAKTPGLNDDKYIIDRIVMCATQNPTKYPFLNEPYYADHNYKLYEIMISILDY